MTEASSGSPFGGGLFGFLAELREHNDRAWFREHAERYERDVLEPSLAFVEDFAPRLERISRHLVADPRRSGGTLMRIHRDIRFSRDKTPYRTSIGFHFKHERASRTASTPGLYLSLGPGRVVAGGGVWRPDGPSIRRIREAIAERTEAWNESTRSSRFSEHLTLGGERLKRVPAEFGRDHPAGDDLRLKDVVCTAELLESDATSPGFADRYEEIAQAATPLLAFLCEALDLPF